MKVVIATCFESNEERASFVKRACEKRAYETRVFSSDFSHIRKEKREHGPEGFDLIGTKPYKRNLSIERILSHHRFAKDLFVQIEKEDPDLIWLMVPANSLIRQARIYKKKHPDKKIIIDIIDMWPESLPVNFRKDRFPLTLWKKLRADNLNCADALVSECDLYQQILEEEYDGKITTIRWARDSKAIRPRQKIDFERLNLVYIGSINNIIATEKIASIIANMKMPVTLHVIGEGENTASFLVTLKKVCEVIYHGPIRDEQKKAKIFALCHAGINIYREGLYIGLTVKCIDYFEHGLPIINNIKGDTWNFVEEYGAGVNVDGENIVDATSLIEKRADNERIYELFDENLSLDVFNKRCLQVIDEVMR
ncbi:MAG: hypothetical protein IJI46_04925 [Erysipelotrichaceae bacterium]|nr:hypothetical protein [Erysipelotrichaceae bacterium]